MAILGLATVCLAICAAVLLVAGFIAKSLPAAIITAMVGCLFGGLWFVFPLIRREDTGESEGAGPAH
jgi:hypothetical protein